MGIWHEYLSVRTRLENLGIEGKNIWKWTFKKKDWTAWNEFALLSTFSTSGFLLHSNQPPGLIDIGNCWTSSDTVSCLRRIVLYKVSYTIRPFTQSPQVYSLISYNIFLFNIFSLTYSTKESSVTNDPGSKPDHNYAGRRDRQIYIRKNNV